VSGKGELRRENRRVILEALFRTPAASRIDLVRTTGLSPSTVGQIAGELLAEGILVESGIVDLKRGRKPRLLQVNPDAGRVLGLELSGRTAAVYDLRCNERASFAVLAQERDLAPEKLARALADHVRALQRSGPPLVALGVSVPGRVETESGFVVTSAPLGWSDVPLGAMLAEATGLPTVVQPNMVSLVLEEAASGIAKGVRNFLYLHVGMRGIAAGIAVGGAILHGAHGSAGEIGHVQVDPGGPPCHCGKRGCLGAVASGEAVLAAAKSAFAAAGRESGPASIHDLAHAASSGDPIARLHVERAGAVIGEALAGAINLVDPELVAVGGAFAEEAAEILLPAIERTALGKSAIRGFVPCAFALAPGASSRSARGAARAAIHRRLTRGFEQSGGQD